ncbi:hypothetical protein PM082_019669 [Marasmius tenuissimus]|nr:hypothetical protein PM082_019669 [Marasmius tenuissimus]
MENSITPDKALSFIATSLAQTRLFVDMGVCAVTLYIYDTLLNLDLEFRFVWASPWSLVKVLYLLQRYLPFVDSTVIFLYLLSIHKPGPCLAFTHAFTWSGMVGIFLSEGKHQCNLPHHHLHLFVPLPSTVLGLMTLRVWAVWGRNIYVTVVLGIAYLGCYTVAGFYAWKSLETAQYSDPPFPLPSWEGCFLTGANNFQYLTYTMIMVYNTIAKAYHGAGRAGVMKVIYQDGIKFFAVLFLCSLVNVILIATDGHYTSLLSIIQRVLHPIIASRAIIHIREQASKQEILVASGKTTIQLRSFDVQTSTMNNVMD